MWDIPSPGVNISVGCQKQVMKEAISVKFRSLIDSPLTVQWPESFPYSSISPPNFPTAACAPAVKRASCPFHLHGDPLGSTSLTTRGSAETASRADYAYGSERAATGDLQTDHTFTGQKRDATGLMYYNARYYDPALGTFDSPDSVVPGAGNVTRAR